MNRQHVLMIVAVTAVAPALYFSMQILYPEEFEEAAKPYEPPAGCVGDGCGEEDGRPDSPGPSVQGPETNSTPGSAPAPGGGGGGSSFSGSVIGELLDLGGLNEQCLTWVVDYCDSWEHALYDPNSLPNGNQTFPQAFPQCQQIEFFAGLGQPTPQDCQALYQNISESGPP
jgi:hypothetical protein